MKLSFLERLVVNSPIRALSLHRVEPWIFGKLAGFPRGADVMDLGCGNGQGLVMLAQKSSPATLIGVDIDEQQLAAARKTLQKRGVTATLLHASANKLPLPAQSLDVITSFGALHHVYAWQQAVAEVTRTLRPGGQLYAMEFYRPLLTLFGPLIRHPSHRFTHAELLEELTRQGFTILAHRNILNLWGFIVARRPVALDQYD